MDDLNIAQVENAINSMPRDDPNYAHNLNAFGTILQDRYRTSGRLQDIDHAIAFESKSLKSPVAPNVQAATHLNQLCVAYQSRFPISQSRKDLDEAIKAGDLCVEIAEKTQTDSIPGLNNLGAALYLRFSRFGKQNDLVRAIKVGNKAIELMPQNHPSTGSLYHNIACFQKELFHKSNQISHLEAAVESCKKSIGCSHESQPDGHNRRNTLAALYQLRFQRLGSVDDLDLSIKTFDECLRLTSPGNPIIYGYQTNIGTALLDKFEVAGALTDLNRAITMMNSALENLPNDHIDRAACLNNLSFALLRRFEREGAAQDLKDAIKDGYEGLKLSSEHHPRFYARVNNLALALQTSFKRTQSIDDIDNALSLMKNVVERCPKTHPSRYVLFVNLGTILQDRFLVSKNKKKDLYMLKDAVEAMKKALKCCPDDHPDAMMIQNNVGNLLRIRFQETRSKKDLDSSIEALSLAVKRCPEGHPNRAMIFHTTGDSLKSRYDLTKLPEYLNKAAESYAQGAGVVSSPPTERIECARKAASLLHYNNPERAAKILQQAVELLPKTCPRILERNDQQYLLSKFGGLASDAAALCIKSAGDPEQALTLLELGRGIMADLLLEQRGDLQALKEADPVLAQAFDDLRQQMDPAPRHLAITPTDMPQEPLSKSNQRIRQLSDDLDMVLESIRKIPGFEFFLKSPSVAYLKSCARENSSVVVVNVSQYGSDAILVTSENVRNLKLLNLRYDDVTKIARKMFLHLDEARGARRDARPKSNKQDQRLADVLKWLWENAIKYVLDELGYAKSPSINSNWPRVWWIPVGPLSLLPIHAAGSSTMDFNALDRVISSYGTTIKALLHARSQMENVSNLSIDKVGLVCMATTPGEKPLPFAAAEVHRVKELLPSSIKTDAPERPTKKDVMRLLRECNVLHFACHGQTNIDPSLSRLLLSDWENNPFTVGDISRLKSDSCRFAYLSACQTASSETESLLDEGIHMAGACLLAGFPSVVGTLWEIEDEMSAQVAEKVYNGMKGKDEKLDVTKAAEALHFAIRNLRMSPILKQEATDIEDSILWASYIHFGV